MRVLALCLAMVTFSAVMSGQDLVQGALDGLNDPQTARAATILVQEQPGVMMARFDVPTKNMMLHVSPDCAIDRAALNAWLAPLGITVRCYARRDVREAPFRHIDPLRCGQVQLQVR